MTFCLWVWAPLWRGASWMGDSGLEDRDGMGLALSALDTCVVFGCLVGLWLLLFVCFCSRFYFTNSLSMS